MAVYCLQQSLSGLQEGMIQMMSRDDIAALLRVLSRSRHLSEAALKNEDLAHAFKEAMFDYLGLEEDGIVEEARYTNQSFAR